GTCVAADPRRFKHGRWPDCKGEAVNCNVLVQVRRSRPEFRQTKQETGETMTSQTAAKRTSIPQTPPLPQARPESLGLSPTRLQRMSDAFMRDIDKGTIPGVTVMVARRGQIGWFEPLGRPMTIHDLLRHTSGITYDHTGNGLVQQLYQQSRLRSRKISNAEHAALMASLPLMCQPGVEWNYSRSTDILGRIIEIVSGKTLSAFLTERIL